MCIRDRYSDVYFTESFDGGNSWTDPAEITQNWGAKKNIVVLLEKDTGRVYVMHADGENTRLATREPGARIFTHETIASKYRSQGIKHLVQVKDKKTSQRTLYLFASTEEGAYRERIDYLKSFNSTNNWTDARTIVSGAYSLGNIPMAVGTEGHFYIQYFAGANASCIKAVWTKDYGETWEPPILIAETSLDDHTMTMCGKGSNEKVFSINGKTSASNGYIKYVKPGQTDFKDLNYPFPQFDQIVETQMSCAHSGNGKYTLALILEEQKSHRVHIAYGIAHNL
eukprot:TRINITY_DN7154_c0_g1_i5.p1 TRINITY_DN7154_c0_g1~~TRINITY_DN7154_c0_g1_i5.p1  ORF type:complete len:283 (-),score=20.27 TRINITY_DN7154_c0_g1_i5:156-1004(-)